MTNARTAVHWLGDIIRWGEKLDRHITGLSREQFLDDEKTQDAALKCAEAIGEAASQLMALDPTYDSRHPGTSVEECVQISKQAESWLFQRGY